MTTTNTIQTMSAEVILVFACHFTWQKSTCQNDAWDGCKQKEMEMMVVCI